MRNIFLVLVICALVAAFGCSSTDPPQFRLHNQHAQRASVQIKTSGGNTININNIDPGAITPYQSVSEGAIEVTGTVQGEPNPPLITFNAANGSSYTIVVANTSPPTFTVGSP